MMHENPFEPYDYYLRDGEELDVCGACTAMVKKRSSEEREGVWSKLPVLLYLELQTG